MPSRTCVGIGSSMRLWGTKQIPTAARRSQRFDEDARTLIDCVDDGAVAFVRMLFDGSALEHATPQIRGRLCQDDR